MNTRMIERMRALPDSEKGAACIGCGTSAVDCQATFLESDQQQWCCPSCTAWSPWRMHQGNNG